jgi:hypothetical protein
MRYLIEDTDFLAAGGEKTLIVFGADYRMTHHAERDAKGPSNQFAGYLARHGFYSILPDGSIRRRSRGAVVETLVLERTKITGLLKELVNIVYTTFKSTRVQNPDLYRRQWQEVMGPRWSETINAEVGVFSRLLEYLQSHKVKVVVIAMPQPSWDSALPFQQTYLEQVRAVCEAAGVTIHDFRKLIPDEEYADSVHLTTTGIEEFQRAVMGICIDHLRASAAVSPSAHTASLEFKRRDS